MTDWTKADTEALRTDIVCRHCGACRDDAESTPHPSCQHPRFVNAASALECRAADEIERLQARVVELEAERAELSDKALRFDLDRVGVEARERDAVELVEARATIAELQARIAELEEAERVRREGHAAKVGAFKERLRDPGYAERVWDNLEAALNAAPQDAEQASFESGYDHGFAEAEREAKKRITDLEAERAEVVKELWELSEPTGARTHDALMTLRDELRVLAYRLERKGEP